MSAKDRETPGEAACAHTYGRQYKFRWGARRAIAAVVMAVLIGFVAHEPTPTDEVEVRGQVYAEAETQEQESAGAREVEAIQDAPRLARMLRWFEERRDTP